MDYLNPETQKKQHLYLLLGYVMITIGVMLATAILLSLAYGFSFTRSGELIEQGKIYVSSAPAGASVSIDGKTLKNKTNTRLLLKTGRYTLKLEKAEYQSWQRSIVVNGGVLERFDYPLLIPKDLKTETIKTFSESVAEASQSRDRRWVIVQRAASSNEFTLYDLNEPKGSAVVFDVPSSILSDGATTQWKTVEWSTDNRRALMMRTFMPAGSSEATVEYVIIDRQAPDESVNVSNALTAGASEIRLVDGKYDKYYVYNAAEKSLRNASLKEPEGDSAYANVLSFKSYSDNRLLYVTTEGAGTKNVSARLQDGKTTYALTDLPANDIYYLDMASHDDASYVVVGAQSQGRISVFKNPIESRKQLPDQPLVPVQVLKVDAPKSIAFSDNTRFIMATNGQDFYTYDFENDKGYQYTAKEPLDAPQLFGRWINGHQISYVSNGKLVMFDYDYTNVRTLQAADPKFLPFFERDYRYVYSLRTVAADGGEGSELTQTALRIEADL